MINLEFAGNKTQINTLELFEFISDMQNAYAHINYAKSDFVREQLVKLNVENLEAILNELLEHLNLSEGKNV